MKKKMNPKILMETDFAFFTRSKAYMYFERENKEATFLTYPIWVKD